MNKIKDNESLLKNYVAGIVLKGWEVKEIKNKNLNVKNSIISFISNILFVKNFIVIKNEKYLNFSDFNRLKKVLLNKFEIKEIISNFKNFKIIVSKVFLKKNIVKMILSVIKNKLGKL